MKLKSRWSGTFSVSHVFPQGVVKVQEVDSGREFTVNEHCLKHHYKEDVARDVGVHHLTKGWRPQKSIIKGAGLIAIYLFAPLSFILLLCNFEFSLFSFNSHFAVAIFVIFSERGRVFDLKE